MLFVSVGVLELLGQTCADKCSTALLSLQLLVPFSWGVGVRRDRGFKGLENRHCRVCLN